MGGIGCRLLRLPEVYEENAFQSLLDSHADWVSARRAETDAQSDAKNARREAATVLADRAEAAKKKAPHGEPAETFLPFVRAACAYWDQLESDAIEQDNTALAFTATSQRLEFGRSFRELTGRDFDLAQDKIEQAEVDAIPDPGPAPPSPPKLYACLECGFETQNPRLIDDGGMGCVQCNH
jgi:hypothetical protein